MLRRRSTPGDSPLDLPGYTDLTVIGTGSSGVVYRAYQARLDRVVAVKFVLADLSGDDLLARWERECRASGRLSRHPYIVTVLDAGVSPAGRPYLVMDWYPQGSLATALRAGGPMPVGPMLSLGVKLSGALETAHRMGILHRDVKPENVLLGDLGEPALADFGIAGVAGTVTAQLGPRALTPVHTAPEVLDDQPASPASDIYSLGSVLYTALAGRAAYEAGGGEGLAALLARVLRQPPPALGRADVPAELEATVAGAMAKDPRDRPGSAEALGQRLQQLQVQLGERLTDLVITGAPSTGAPSIDPMAAPTSPTRPPDGGLAAGWTVSREPRRDPGTPIPAPASTDPTDHRPRSQPVASTPGQTGTVTRPSRAGRVAEAAPEAPPRPGRRWVWWAVAAAGGVAVAVIGVVVAGAVGGGHAPPTVTTIQANHALAPTNVRVTLLGRSSAQLRWQDNAGGKYPYVVLYTPPLANGDASDATGLGATSYLVTGLPANQRTCFQVALVDGPDQNAWPTAAPVCMSPG